MIYSSSRERGEAFDLLIESAGRLLASEKVRAALGELAVRLDTLNRGAFMPEMRGNRLCIPKVYRATENVAVVPLGKDESDPNMLISPALARIETAGSVRRVGHRLADVLCAEACASKLGNTIATTRRYRYSEYDRLRPIIFVGPRVFDDAKCDLPDLRKGYIMTHEYIHADDVLRRPDFRKDIDERASAELLAYHVQLTAERAFRQEIGSDGDCHGMAVDVEQIRLAHTTPEHPFTSDSAGVTKLVALGII